MDFKSLAIKCALLTALALVGEALARPDGLAPVASTLSAENVRQIQATLKEALPLYRPVSAKNAHKEHDHGRLTIVHLILIIGKVIAPLVGAIVEPLLVNIAKGITWAITYSLASGFDKPPGYEHFVPALVHHHNGGGGGGGGGEEYDDQYESHKPDAYSLKELPGLALQLTSSVLEESADQQPDRAEAMENVEKTLAGLLLKGKPVAR